MDSAAVSSGTAARGAGAAAHPHGKKPLAATSTNAAIRWIGAPGWQRLHRLVYVIATCGVIHYWWLVKKDITQPLIYASVLAMLLLFRVVQAWRKRSSSRD